MASYVLLLNWTDQGIRTIKTWPERVVGARKMVENLGGTIHSLYVTLGAYDAMAVVHGLDDDSITKLVIGLGRIGNVRTSTLRAFPEAEAQQLIQDS